MIFYLSLINSQDDQDKFTQLYNKYKNTMLYVANSILNNQYLAEDVVHESFIKIISILDKINDINCSKTKSLIVIIVKHKSIDFIRKEDKNVKIPIDDYENYISDNSEQPLDKIINQQDYEKLIECIGNLNEKYKVVLELKYIHGYSDVEIANILDLTQKNVNMRVYRAKQKLKNMLSEEMCNNA